MVAAPWHLPLLDPADRLHTRCMYCRTALPLSSHFSSIPPGRSFAFDPATGRIWSICARCRRWNLIPLNERFEAVEALEQLVRDRGVCAASTANIALYHVDDLELVRIGAAMAIERDVWRYGRQVIARMPANQRPSRRVAVMTAAAIARAGESVGAWKLGREQGRVDIVEVLRWQRFGTIAWNGRSGCPYCGSVLHTLHFDSSWWLYPRIEDGRLVVGVPCTRCDPWTPKNVFDLTGEEAQVVLRRALAYQHVTGADERDVGHATQLIREAGSADALVRRLSSGRSSLWRLGPLKTLAFEIAINHIAEHRLLDDRLHALLAEWRAEEDIARIVDNDLS